MRSEDLAEAAQIHLGKFSTSPIGEALGGVTDLDVPGIRRTMVGASQVPGSRNTRRVATILLHTRRSTMRADWLGQEVAR